MTHTHTRARARTHTCACTRAHRYGDPINPHGDAAAMGEFAMLLRPSGPGLLFLGVPVGARGRATQGGRTYSRARFESLLERSGPWEPAPRTH